MMWLEHVQQLIPPGYTAENRGSDHVIVIHCSTIGGVTIDFQRRAYALGYGFSAARAVNATKYTGRGWSQRVVRDAVRALEACRRRA